MTAVQAGSLGVVWRGTVGRWQGLRKGGLTRLGGLSGRRACQAGYHSARAQPATCSATYPPHPAHRQCTHAIFIVALPTDMLLCLVHAVQPYHGRHKGPHREVTRWAPFTAEHATPVQLLVHGSPFSQLASTPGLPRACCNFCRLPPAHRSQGVSAANLTPGGRGAASVCCLP